ncbi:hypothetical protein ABZP36_013763 [Zizania latifolia]
MQINWVIWHVTKPVQAPLPLQNSTTISTISCRRREKEEESYAAYDCNRLALAIAAGWAAGPHVTGNRPAVGLSTYVCPVNKTTKEIRYELSETKMNERINFFPLYTLQF